MSTRVWAHLGITALVLLVANGLIWQKESLLRRGEPMLLKLAPVDPRSLMQGDYMALRYEVARDVPWSADGLPANGRLVIRLDEHRVASFVRVDRGEPLAPGEKYLCYHAAGPQARLGAESFFFQEGEAEKYAHARYGELKVAPGGESVLVGLCGDNFERLGATEAARERGREP